MDPISMNNEELITTIKTILGIQNLENLMRYELGNYLIYIMIWEFLW